jgi:hypothetical protein
LIGTIYGESRPRRQIFGQEPIAELWRAARDGFAEAGYARAQPNVADCNAPFVASTARCESDRATVLPEVLNPGIALLILGRRRGMRQSSVLMGGEFSPGWLLRPGEDSGGANVE